MAMVNIQMLRELSEIQKYKIILKKKFNKKLKAKFLCIYNQHKFY